MEIYTPSNEANLKRAILWQYEKAARLQALVGYEQTFFDDNVTDFWNAYRNDIFMLETANSFGLRVWGINLGVERPKYDSYVPATTSSDAVPVGLQPSATWPWTRTTVNDERIYNDPTGVYAYWYSTSKGWIFSTVLDVGNEDVKNYFVYQYYPETITISGTGTAVDGTVQFTGASSSRPAYLTGQNEIFYSSLDSGWLTRLSDGFPPEMWLNLSADLLPPMVSGWTTSTKGSPAPSLSYTIPAANELLGMGDWSGTITISSSAENISFTDEMYRSLLTSRLMLIRMTATIPHINEYMETLIPDNACTVTDGLDMTISYKFQKELTNEELAVLSIDGILPRPAGVEAVLVIANGETQFGFEGQLATTGDSSTQQGNFDNASFAAE